MFKITSAIAALTSTAFAAVEADRVHSLPQMENFTRYDVFSGLIPIEGTGKNYHYMFVGSQGDPANDPLVVWFNGGPGCSSMVGFAQEIGPYKMDDDDPTFLFNPYSWNNFSNQLYIESPAGVGFSNCSTQEECNFDDNTSAEDNYQVLLRWLSEEYFGEYANHDLFISGESYAGIYVPYVTRLLHLHNKNPDNEFKFNLKGWMIGDGVTNWAVDATPAYIEMGYYHGLYSTDLHDKLASCNLSYIDVDTSDISDYCLDLVDQFNNETSHIFVYDIYRPWIEPSDALQELKQFSLKRKLFGAEKKISNQMGPQYTPWRYGYKKPLGDDPCPYESPLSKYFNRDDVKEALHVESYPDLWNMCNFTYEYTSSKNGSQWIWEELHDNTEGYRFLKYSGDTDGSVPTLGTEAWINQLGWDILEAYRPYYLPNGELGGYVEERDGLTFATVHGAGHMVPQFKRPEAVYLIKNWLQGNTL